VSILSTLLIMTIATIFLDEKPNNILFAIFFGVSLWCISPIESLLSKINNQHKTVSFYLLKGGVALGAMSYSVYLLHGKLYLLPAMFVRQVVEESSVWYGLVSILLTLLICYPFYYFVERPFMSNNYIKMQQGALFTDNGKEGKKKH
ncbi:MAG: hypothetical protein P8Q24_04890, partial [Glaciecola sp.]|nr:hypothetical protein [Glaciecola sp.]